MRQIKSIVVGLGLLALNMGAHADFIGLTASIDGMYSQPKINDDTHNKHQWDVLYNLAFEHPVPLLPNAKLRFGDFSTHTIAGNEQVNVRTNLNIQTLDAIAYYEILDNIVSIDAGVGLKRINLHAKQSDDVDIFKTAFDSKADKTVPAIYLSAGGKLPFTGLSAKAEALVGKNGSSDFNDLNAEAKYNIMENIALDLGVKLGYRAMTIHVDNHDSSQNNKQDKIEMNGPYLGLEAHF